MADQHPHHAHVAAPAPPGHGVPPSPAWPWFTALAVGVVLAGLLAWRPWDQPGAGADPLPTVTATPDPAPGEPAAPETPDEPEVVLGAADVASLFLTDDELARAVPDAAGMSLAPADEAVWGLPTGSMVDPAACTTAVTVVEQEPEVFERRFASDDTVTVIQSVDLLADPAAARAAFDALVGVLGECPEYQQVNPGVDGGAWQAQPPTTDAGDVTTVVRQATLTAEGASSPEVEVTALVANALVTTTASGVDPDVPPADPAVLAQVAREAGERALADR